MIFKKNNPGCPCCDDCPCACFTFNSDLKSTKGGHEFTAAGTTAFTSGKLGNALEVAYNSTPSANALSAPDNSCFSFEGGLSFWFWLYTNPDCTETNTTISYVLSKGDYFPGNTAQWAVALPVNKQCNQSSNFQYAAAIKKSTGGYQIIGYDDTDYETGTDTDAAWTFYFQYYDPNVGTNGTYYTSINGAGFAHNANSTAIGPAESDGGVALENPIVSNSEPLKLFEAVSSQSGSLKIDNLGFCKNIPAALSDGTTTEQQMAARAASLYNSGTGKACNEWK